MKKEIRDEINKLFEEMKEEIRKVWFNKKCQNIKKWIYYSETIMNFRGKTLKLIKDPNFLWSHEERLEFMRWFWRKTTPYAWFKKELII